MTTTNRLGPAERTESWHRLTSTHFDVLVVGGGITGVGAALDAATRGLSVALVEASDLAFGTSSRSSKLFHGGLRYLEQLNFGLVREALRERDLMLRTIAPHLVKPVPFLYPLQQRGWERPYVGAGLMLYDGMAGRRTLPRHRHLTRSRAMALAPALRSDVLRGAVLYHDAQVDDARHTLTVARTAAHHGAVVRTSTRVVGLTSDGGRVAGARITDVETAAETEVRARAVVNCTGVWTDDIQRLTDGPVRLNVRPSKGVHLVVPRDRIRSDTGMILRTATSVLFVIPWHRHWLVGTTDTDGAHDRANPSATGRDIDYLLDEVNRVLATPLTRADITGVYAGLRPLLTGDETSPSRLSREHTVVRPTPGLVSVAGGKYTTYRVMAAAAIDATAEDLRVRLPPSITHRVPLLGADGYHALVNRVDGLAHRHAIAPWRVRRLLDRYGNLVEEVLRPTADDPRLLEPVDGAADYLAAELLYGVTHEGALHLDDLLSRRTHISIEVRDGGTRAARAVARIVADPLRWDASTIEAEVAKYVAGVAAAAAAHRQEDDTAPDAALGRTIEPTGVTERR
ncbi:glycerol-3-phosphate dehydrogenase/oxidase [Nocardioides sp. YIM 152315]|uniref:glycerol-3-phosphate dehydrogenase/oxidase n=1 Tax=Nocardioides sp. YIM 152315 TaxID=3031760 RepID=UPI0023DA75A9|nr:glycerol-3-phosphate dehydrogenase/oxidase [Nocardioides sp. YIM 152315]MDF1602625.1 glycerol-3-phosphate dehydrogenase/oxidase [Nocardioides sp. YIM 152315]